MLYKISFPHHTTVYFEDKETVYFFEEAIYKWHVKRNKKCLCRFEWTTRNKIKWVEIK